MQVTSLVWCTLPFPVISGRQKMGGPPSQALRELSRNSPGPAWLLRMTVLLYLPWGMVCHSRMTEVDMVQTNSPCLQQCTVQGQ